MSDIQAHHLSSVWVHAPNSKAPQLYSSLDQTKFLLQSTDLDMNDEPEYFIFRNNITGKLGAMTLKSENDDENLRHRRRLREEIDIHTSVLNNNIARSPQLDSEAGFITQSSFGVAKHIAENCASETIMSTCIKEWEDEVEHATQVNLPVKNREMFRSTIDKNCQEVSSDIYRNLIDLSDIKIDLSDIKIDLSDIKHKKCAHTLQALCPYFS